MYLAETLIEFVLALNRCVSMLSPNFARTLFGSTDIHWGKSASRTWLWVIPSIGLGFWHTIYGTPYVFSPIIGVGSVPHEGYANDMDILVY
jgi:hypothetical protein